MIAKFKTVKKIYFFNKKFLKIFVGISCPIGQILNNKMVPCTQCADPWKLTIEDFTTMEITCKTMTELEIGYGVVNQFAYSKCQTLNCKRILNLTLRRKLFTKLSNLCYLQNWLQTRRDRM